jgi:hypothetical protein
VRPRAMIAGTANAMRVRFIAAPFLQEGGEGINGFR